MKALCLIDNLYTFVYNVFKLMYTNVYKRSVFEMRGSGFREHMREGHHRGGRHRGMEGAPQRGAKTFRRGKAISF